MSITSLINDNQEELLSLVDYKEESKELVDPFSDLRENSEYFEKLQNKYRNFKFDFVDKTVQALKGSVKLFWFGTSTAVAVVLTLVLLFNPNISNDVSTPKYSIYSSKPIVAGIASAGIGQDDARAARIDAIFEEYNCPIRGMGKVFVSEAEKNDIPYWLVAAIAFQESSCGKYTPKVEGSESSNLWGWGVWGEHIYMFEDVDEGIGIVSKYMAENFYSQGITDPCLIMKTYTPPSNGSWCKGVKFFRDQIMDYTSPSEY